MIRYDAVTYLKYLDTLRVSEGVRSVWMFAEASHTIFELAKRRVYQVVRADGVRITTTSGMNKKKRKINDGSKKANESGRFLKQCLCCFIKLVHSFFIQFGNILLNDALSVFEPYGY